MYTKYIIKILKDEVWWDLALNFQVLTMLRTRVTDSVTNNINETNYFGTKLIFFIEYF